MYSGRLVYQSSFCRTSGVSSGSMAKPTRMRCHRSGSGMGTSSGSSNGSGNAAGLGAAEEAAAETGVAGGGWAGAAARAQTDGRPRASTPANVRRYRFRSVKLILVSAGLFHRTPPSCAGSMKLQREREVAHQRAGRAHRYGRALAIGVVVGNQVALAGEGLEVLAQDPVGGVVEAHHVERRPDSTVLDPERCKPRHAGEPAGRAVGKVAVPEVADVEAGAERLQGVGLGELARREVERLRRLAAVGAVGRHAVLARRARAHERGGEPAALDQRHRLRPHETLALESRGDALARVLA